MSFNNEEIEYLCKELIDKKLYRIRNYIINDLNCTMFVSNKTDNKYICLETNAFDETEIQICEIEYNCKSTKNLVEFIISFRDNYQYSKVLDSVVNKKEIEKIEHDRSNSNKNSHQQKNNTSPRYFKQIEALTSQKKDILVENSLLKKKQEKLNGTILLLL